MFDTKFVKVPRDGNIIVKDKVRHLEYNKHLNLYKRKRTFDGIYHLKHWNIIGNFIDLNKKLTCLEIGSHEGQSAMYFLKEILKHKDSKLYCCDPWIKSHWLNINPTNLCYEDLFDFNVKNNNGGSKIIKYRGVNSSLYQEEYFTKLFFDIIYIDDIHTYKSTVLNIDKCWPQLKIGGIIIFDDYEKDFAIYDEKDAIKFCDPVKKAVNEFIDRTDNLVIIFKEYQLILQKI